MTKTSLLSLEGKSTGEIELPAIFETPFRPEVIHKVYVNTLSHSYQRQGRYPAAGEMVSAESRNTGLGIARLARARGEGFQRAGQAASVAGVRHGRVAHPPESWKNVYKKTNKKERLLGLCSAVAATANRELVLRRGHKIPDNLNFPIVVSDQIESLTKTRDLEKALRSLGLDADYERARKSHKVQSGTARRRGRQARVGVSTLIVIGDKLPISSLSNSISGVDIKPVDEISVIDLAPGSKPIRLTLYSESAIKRLSEIKTRVNKVLEASSARVKA